MDALAVQEQTSAVVPDPAAVPAEAAAGPSMPLLRPAPRNCEGVLAEAERTNVAAPEPTRAREETALSCAWTRLRPAVELQAIDRRAAVRRCVLAPDPVPVPAEASHFAWIRRPSEMAVRARGLPEQEQ